jgi:hypothetical protein
MEKKIEMDIYKAGVACDLTIHWYKGMIKLNPEDLGFEEFPETELISLGRKKLIQKKHIKKIYSIVLKAQAFLRNNGFIFPIGQTWFVPYTRLEAVLGKMAEYRQDFDREVNDFIALYGTVRQEMIDEYRKIFTQILQEHHKLEGEGLEFEVGKLLNRLVMRFPSESALRSKFRFEFLVFEIGSPDFKPLEEGGAIDKARLNRELEAEYQAKVRDKVDGFLSDVVAQLKQMVLETTGNMIVQLERGTLNKNTIKGFKNFADTFKQLDFVDVTVDVKLEELQRRLDGASKEDLKNEEFKARLKEDIDSVTNMARNINVSKVLGKFKRMITIRDEDEDLGGPFYELGTKVEKEKRMIQIEEQV